MNKKASTPEPHFNKLPTPPCRPPLGLMPEHIYEEKCNAKRIDKIFSAIGRYQKAGVKVPVEWGLELNSRILNKPTTKTLATGYKCNLCRYKKCECRAYLKEKPDVPKPNQPEFSSTPEEPDFSVKPQGPLNRPATTEYSPRHQRDPAIVVWQITSGLFGFFIILLMLLKD